MYILGATLSNISSEFQLYDYIYIYRSNPLMNL